MNRPKGRTRKMSSDRLRASPGGLFALLVFAGGMIAPAQGADAVPRPYLADSEAPLLATILPAPPDESDRQALDRRVFRATRDLAGTPRWTMAMEDGAVGPRDVATVFACALGAELEPDETPRLTQLLRRVAQDANRVASLAKLEFKRPRPYLLDEGETCVARATLGPSYDYPSGHSVWGWSVGLVLAELAPDRATPILARARAFGESRVACGVHSPSAVEAGQIGASSLVAVLHGSPEFRADLAEASKELAVARLKPGATPPVEACLVESTLVSQPLVSSR